MRLKSTVAFQLVYMIATGFLFVSCSNKLSEIPKDMSGYDYTKEVAENVQIILSQRGQLKTEITAPKLVRDDQAKPPYAEMPEGLKADFFDEEGAWSTTLTARFARYFPRSQNILVRDSVVVENADGSKLFTEELIWSNASQKFYTDAEVFILKDGNMAYGDGLEANRELTEVKILHQRGVIPVAKDALDGDENQ